jgi:hypothetical protein
MMRYYGLTDRSLPADLTGSDAEYSISFISERERIAIEDYFFSQEMRVRLSTQTTAIIVPYSSAANLTMEEFAVLIECALGILTLSGFMPIKVVAKFNDSSCSSALQRIYEAPVEFPTFPKKLGSRAAVQWIRHFFEARVRARGLHITADRFVRYLKASNSRDSLVDLCICLESLIEAQTEISFRFATCLSKICNLEGTLGISDLLADLYDLRSKVVHGTDSTKEHKRVEPNASRLRLVARAILSSYILYMTNHTKDEWKNHLRNSLFA